MPQILVNLVYHSLSAANLLASVRAFLKCLFYIFLLGAILRCVWPMVFKYLAYASSSGTIYLLSFRFPRN
jgi:hypothetical protein